MENNQQETTCESDFDKDAIEYHMEKLQNICRLCGGIMTKCLPKLKFVNDFKKLFDINVESESKEIYPQSICPKHGAVFYRYRTAARNKEQFSTDLTPIQFVPHGKECKICCSDLSQPEHNLKEHAENNSHGPGRGKRSAICIEPQMSPTKKVKLDETAIFEAYQNIEEQERENALKYFFRQLSFEEKKQVLQTIFEEQKFAINTDIEYLQRKFHSIGSLDNLDIQNLLANKQNSLLLQTLLLLSNGTIEQDFYRLSILLENIYKLRNANFIGPLSALQNLTILSLTGSKLAVDICGRSGAGGSYSFLCKWLGDIPTESKESPDGDILLAFDNEQIIGKTWNIKPNNKVNCSVITTVTAIELQSEKKLQSDHSLSPSSWFTQNKVNEVLDKVVIEDHDMYQAYKKEHYNQFKLFVSAAIDQIKEEFKDQDSDIIDQIVVKCKQKRELKICPGCNNFYPKTKRKCQQCKLDLNKLPEFEQPDDEGQYNQINVTPLKACKSKSKDDKEEAFRFDHVEHFHPDQDIPVYVLDPVFVNPNSIENLKLVLRHLGKLSGIKRYGDGDRVWTIICCDGLPYTMLCRMIEEYFTCTICSRGFLGKEAFSQHKKQHQDVNNVEFVREFDWVLLKTGDGHYEMNLMKSFVELNWEIFMKMLSTRMGWTSETAMKAAKLCYDNHKTWQLILTFHLGTLQELLVPYVRKCQKNTDFSPTPAGFLEFTKTMESNPNYMYLFEMVSRYSQAIINFRISIRRNNSTLVQSAKFMAKGLFHGRVHPRYQQIEMLDTVHRFLMPEPLQAFMNQHESMSKSPDSSKGQGYDFILEEINKDIKSWVRRGVASDNMWLGVCRNFDTLKSLKSKLKNILQIDTDVTVTRKINLDEDWRVCLRETEYITKEKFTHESIQGLELHRDLVKFTEEANRKRNYRLLEVILQQDVPDDHTLKHPVFVTEEEANHYQSFENQSIEIIDFNILGLLDQIFDDEKRELYLAKFEKEVLRKRKVFHVDFFNEILEVINEQTVPGGQAIDTCDNEEDARA